MMMGPGYFGGFGMGGGSLMMLVVFLAIGYLLYLAFNQNRGNSQTLSRQSRSSEALELAKSRLALGEITVEEFEQIKTNIL
jgi:putative membrane protein